MSIQPFYKYSEIIDSSLIATTLNKINYSFENTNFKFQVNLINRQEGVLLLAALLEEFDVSLTITKPQVYHFLLLKEGTVMQ